MSDGQKISVTEKIIADLHKHKCRTKVGASLLLRIFEKEIPEGLSMHLINNWLSGQTKTAKPEFINWAMKVWSSLPDDCKREYSKTLKRVSPPRPDYVEITNEIRKKILYYREKEFIPRGLYKLHSDIPKGLNRQLLSRWLLPTTKYAKKSHLDYVFSRCEGMETHPNRPVVLTAEIMKQLEYYKECTGMGAGRLAKYAKSENIPEGFGFYMVSNWFSGIASTTQINYLEYVQGLYLETLNKL